MDGTTGQNVKQNKLDLERQVISHFFYSYVETRNKKRKKKRSFEHIKQGE